MKKVYFLFVLLLVVSFIACITSNDTNTKKECGDCPQFAPPAPDWCKDGTIVSGVKNECGCQMPPTCEKKQ